MQLITEDKVIEALKGYKAGESVSELAKRFDVREETLKTWILKAGLQWRKRAGKKDWSKIIKALSN